MIANDIFKKIDRCFNHLNFEQFIDLIPLIIEDIKYMYIDIKNDISKLSFEEQWDYEIEIIEKIINYSAQLVKLIYRFQYNIDLNIQYKNDLLKGVSAYDSVNDEIIYNTMGMLLGSKAGEFSYLSSFFHEARHKSQQDFLRENDIVTLIDYPSEYFIIGKEIIYYESMNLEDKEKFYMDNYKKMFFEFDAFINGLADTKGLVRRLFQIYSNNNRNNNRNNIDNIQSMILNITPIVSGITNSILEEYKKDFPDYYEFNGELYTEQFIYSTYIKDGQEVDRLFEVDKYIKNHPELQNKYPFLKLLFNGEKLKSYDEIINDISYLISLYPDKKNNIESLYLNVIKTDPVLYVTYLVDRNESRLMEEFISYHKDFFEIYSSELDSIREKCKTEEMKELIESYLRGFAIV